MADPDLQMMGGGGGGGGGEGGGGGLVENEGGRVQAPRAPPLDPPLVIHDNRT